MKHFLLTRWNLPGALQEPGLERVSDPRWRERRRELFERYCLPSVARQTAGDFLWLFLVYEALTGEAERRWFEGKDERLRLVGVEDPRSSGAAEAQHAVRGLLSQDEWVVTTRLDSDDVLHPDHLRSVRVEPEGQRRVVEFLQGFYYDVLQDRLRRVREPQNAFVTVIEPADGLRTAFGWSHPEIAREHEILYLEQPGWIALVHDRNAVTYLWGDRMSAREQHDVLREFGVRRPSYVGTRLRRTRAFPGRAARRAHRAAARARARYLGT